MREGWRFLPTMLLAVGCDGGLVGRPLPGPCRARTNLGADFLSSTWSYDQLGRTASLDVVGGPPIAYHKTVTFSRDGADLVEVRSVTGSVDWASDHRFTFGPTVELHSSSGDSPYRIVEDATYEATGFQFLGHPVEPVMDAPDALLYRHQVVKNEDGPGGETIVERDEEITCTFDGPPRQGTRVRTCSDGSVTTFRYDLEGRLLSEVVGTSLPVGSWTYDGSFLLEGTDDRGLATYRYDGAGNLVRRLQPSIATDEELVTGYEYDCWW
jgi:hypothetical protein